MYLTSKDYDLILDFYKINHNKWSAAKRKKVAHKLLVTKLCRCIKAVKQTRKRNPIKICKQSVLHKKKVTAKKFTCKNKTISLRVLDKERIK